MKIVFFISLVLFLSACSSKSPSNRWQYQSNSAYKNFERYYLENRTDMATVEFDRARSYATQSADLDTLARIELSRCALKSALLEPFSCQEYVDLIPVTHDLELQAYYSLLSGTITNESLSSLPQQYQHLASMRMQNNHELINKEINKITPLTSRMVAAALVVKSLDEATIEAIIADASYAGYKQAVMVWMNLLLQQTNDDAKRKVLREKLKVMTKIS